VQVGYKGQAGFLTLVLLGCFFGSVVIVRAAPADAVLNLVAVNPNPEAHSLFMQLPENIRIARVAPRMGVELPTHEGCAFRFRQWSAKRECHRAGFFFGSQHVVPERGLGIDKYWPLREWTEGQFHSKFSENSNRLAKVTERNSDEGGLWRLFQRRTVNQHAIATIYNARGIRLSWEDIRTFAVNVGDDRAPKMSTLPCADQDEKSGKKSQKSVGNFESETEYRPEFGSLLTAFVALTGAYFALMAGMTRLDDGYRVIGILWLLVGTGLDFSGSIGLLIGMDPWSLWGRI